jgi:hypothetical protein
MGVTNLESQWEVEDSVCMLNDLARFCRMQLWERL